MNEKALINFKKFHEDTDKKGLQLSCYNQVEGIFGAQVGLKNISWYAKGAQVGIKNLTQRVDGCQIGLDNEADDLNGLQLGLICKAGTGKYLQLGLLTYRNADVWYKRFSPGIGFSLSKESKDNYD